MSDYFISRIKLSNFQKHADLELDLTPGVNVLHGETDSGKSCVLRAIRWVLFNDVKGNAARKSGTDKTVVELQRNDGIIVRRIRSASINAYEIVEGDAKPRRYDSIKISVPEEVIKLFNVRPMVVGDSSLILNVAAQLDSPFLLADTASFRTKVFNKITGNDITDQVLQSYNKDLLAASRECKLIESELELKRSALRVVVQDTEKLTLLRDELQHNLSKVKQRTEQYNQVCGLDQQLQSAKDNLQTCGAELMAIALPDGFDALKGHAVQLANIAEIYNRLNEFLFELDQTETELVHLQDVCSCETYLPLLKDRVELVALVRSSTVSLLVASDSVLSVDKELVFTESAVNALTDGYRALLKESGICPICRSPITEDVLHGIGF